MRSERTRERREEIARFVLRAKALRRETIPRFGNSPCTPGDVIDGLIREDPALAERENHKTPLQRIRKEVEREITQERLKL